MKKSLKEFLFTKHILVAEQDEDPGVIINVLTAFKGLLNVTITKGYDLAHRDMIQFMASLLGENVPVSYYRGFPNSVRELTSDQLLFDQLCHYVTTYGWGNFEEQGHSFFETVAYRNPFNEKPTAPKEFVILDEAHAKDKLLGFFNDLAASTRPLNELMQNVIIDCISEYDWFPWSIGSRQTTVDLLYKTKDLRFAKFMKMQDVIKYVDTINWLSHRSEDMKTVRLTSSERKLVTKVLDTVLFVAEPEDIRVCLEKRAIWKGILHQIHYKPKTEKSKELIGLIYNDKIPSYSGVVDRAIHSDKFTVVESAQLLKNTKGNGALLRSLNYFLYMCRSKEQIEGVINLVDAKNPIILFQLLDSYANYSTDNRVFTFIRHERVKKHKETMRKWYLTSDIISYITEALQMKLEESLKGKVNKVYIAPGMEKVCVPVNLSAGESGFGIMPTGSRIKLPEGKKIRAFTYWEKVNDIDLSCFGLCSDGTHVEFSWRTMYGRQSDAITYSGDQTSGYNGGSEFFDVDIDEIRKAHPSMDYIIFCNNVYSGVTFDKVVCRAGWMNRDVFDSGEVYEPKTVESAYQINAKSTFAYLYAIDVANREVVWLNLADAKNHRVAGENNFAWMKKYFTMCETMNMAKLFTMAANEVVNTPEEADLVVGDVETDKPQIHSYDFEKAFSILS